MWIKPPWTLQTGQQLNITKCPLNRHSVEDKYTPAKPCQTLDPRPMRYNKVNMLRWHVLECLRWNRPLQHTVYEKNYEFQPTVSKSLGLFSPPRRPEWVRVCAYGPRDWHYQQVPPPQVPLTLKSEKIRIKTTYTIKMEPKGLARHKTRGMKTYVVTHLLPLLAPQSPSALPAWRLPKRL